MVERRGGLRFIAKALVGVGIFRQLGREKLQRDVTVQPDVERLVDDAHTAATEFVDDAIVRDGLSDHRSRASCGEAKLTPLLAHMNRAPPVNGRASNGRMNRAPEAVSFAPVNPYVALLVAYSIALTALGLWIGRRVRGTADFFVASRRLSWPLITATMLAANIGAGATVGATGVAYRDGVSAWFWNGSAGFGSLILAFVVGPRLWRLASERNYLTVGDFLEDRYGPSVRVVLTSLIWVGTLFILAGQLLVGAAVFTVVAGLPKWAGVVIGGAAMTGYFTAGGLLSSVWVNAVQLVVKFTGFAFAIPILVEERRRLCRHRTDAWRARSLLRSAVSGWRRIGIHVPVAHRAQLHRFARVWCRRYTAPKANARFALASA